MAWTEARGRRYRGMYRDAAGKKRSAGWSDSKREAKRLAVAQELKVAAGTWHSPDAGKMLFSTYWEEHWLPNRLVQPTTYSGYESYYRTELGPAFGAMEVRKIKTQHVQRWVVDMKKRGLSAKLIREKFRCLSVCLGGRTGVSAVNDGLIETSPCDRVQLPKVPRTKKQKYTVEEVERLVERMDEWWRPMIIVMAETGLRLGEIQGLEARDLTGRTLHVERTIVELTKRLSAKLDQGNQTQWMRKPFPKDGEPRDVLLTEQTAALIKDLILARELFPGDRLFPMHDRHGKPLRTDDWPNGRPITRSVLQGAWRRAHRDDIPMRRVHDLRGSMISWMIMGGADFGAVMNRAGHSRLATTQGYFDQFADAQERALRGLEIARRMSRESDERP